MAKETERKYSAGLCVCIYLERLINIAISTFCPKAFLSFNNRTIKLKELVKNVLHFLFFFKSDQEIY